MHFFIFLPFGQLVWVLLLFILGMVLSILQEGLHSSLFLWKVFLFFKDTFFLYLILFACSCSYSIFPTTCNLTSFQASECFLDLEVLWRPFFSFLLLSLLVWYFQLQYSISWHVFLVLSGFLEFFKIIFSLLFSYLFWVFPISVYWESFFGV